MQAQPGFYRVKLYRLNESGGWDDRGTGLVSVGPLETPHASSALGLVVLAEETHRTLLAHRICTDEDIYHRQDDTIITWTDVDVGTDVALSFQEANGCHAIWQHIARLQNEDGRPGVRRRMVDEFESGAQAMDGEYTDGAEGGVQGAVELPPAEMGRLEEVAQVLMHVPPMQRERVAQQLMAPGYLRALLDLFRQAEDLEDSASLTALFQAMRSAVLLNDTALLEELLREEHVMDVMGALEYDPETPAGARMQHRKFLQESVVFKQVVPIDNQETLAKIHQTYRIQYLKDVVLPRCLDDATYATLTSLTLFNNVDVLSALQSDPRFLPRLFGALKEARPSEPAWADLVAFLQELCSLSKHLQLTQRQALWSKMQQLGLFDVLTKVIASGSPCVKLRATDILLSTLGHDPLPLRSFLTRQPGNELLGLLVREMLSAPDDSGLPEQIAELLKLLVDPETMEGAPEKSEFLEVFYDRYMDVLVASVSGDREIGSASAQPRRPAAQQQQQEPVAAAAGAQQAAGPAGQQQQQQQQQQQSEGEQGAAAQQQPAAGPSSSGGEPSQQQQQQQQQGGAAAAAPAAAAPGRGGAGASTSGSDPASLLPADPVPASTIGLIVDLLCYCVQHHQFRAKYHVLRKNVVEKVLKLLRRRERWLVVAGVRFLRTCIGTKDDFYMRYLVRNNLMEPLMTVFFENGARYNLLNSAVLELVEFVRKENIRELIVWLVQNFGDRFDEVDYADTFKQVRIKYDQALEKAEAAAAGADAPGAGADGAAGAAGGVTGRLHAARQRWRRDARDLDRDEEDYFSSERDEHDDGAAAAAAAAGAGPGSAAAAAAAVARQWQPGGTIGGGAAAGGLRSAQPGSPTQQQQQQQQRAGASGGGSPGDAAPKQQQRSPDGAAAAGAAAAAARGGGSPPRGGATGGGGGGPAESSGNWLSSLAQYGDDEGQEGDDAAPGADASAGGGGQQQQQQRQEAGPAQHAAPAGQDAAASGAAPAAGATGAEPPSPQQQASPAAQQHLKRAPDGNGLSPGGRQGSGKRPKIQEQRQGPEEAACAADAS